MIMRVMHLHKTVAEWGASDAEASPNAGHRCGTAVASMLGVDRSFLFCLVKSVHKLDAPAVSRALSY